MIFDRCQVPVKMMTVRKFDHFASEAKMSILMVTAVGLAAIAALFFPPAEGMAFA